MQLHGNSEDSKHRIKHMRLHYNTEGSKHQIKHMRLHSDTEDSKHRIKHMRLHRRVDQITIIRELATKSSMSSFRVTFKRLAS